MYDFLLVAGVVLWGGMLAWYLRHPAASAFHPATYYFVFHGVLFTVRPILARLQTFDGIYRAFRFMPTTGEKITVLLAADLSLIVFVLVSLRVGHAPFTRAAGRTRAEAAPRFTVPLLATLAICLPLPLGVMAYAYAGGSLGAMEFDAATGVSINTTGNGYMKESVLMLGPLALLFAWAGRFRWWALLPLLAFILFKAGTGGRWPFVMAAMSAGLFWMYEHRTRWFPPRILLATLPLLALFTVVGTDRKAVLRLLQSGQEEAAPLNFFAQRPLESMDYGNMEFFEYLVHVVPKKTGTYDYFLNNLQVFTEPVPRVLWPGKPIGPPVQLYKLWDYGTPIGMTSSLPGAGWTQAGWIGVVVWSAFFAWLYGWGYQLFVRSDQDLSKTAAFMILTPVALQTFRDGVLLTILKTSFFPLIPVLVWWGLSRWVAPAPAAALPRRALG